MERGIRRTYTWFYLPDDVFFEPVLKAYEGPDKFFLHNVNAANLAIGCKLVLIAILKQPLAAVAHLRVPGGARRSRTDDILLAKQALYQLSYGPIRVLARRAVDDAAVQLKAGRPGQTRTADLTLIRRTL